MAQGDKKYSKNQSIAVYERTISMPRDAGNTRDDLTPTMIPAHNVTTLESHIQREQICTDERYDWKSGKTRMEPQNVLANAQAHISRLKLTPATSGIRQQRERDVAKRNGDGNGNGCCEPCGYYGKPGSPVPLSGGKKTRY